jgi:long-chain acyl-CoA synthetase
LSNLANLVPAAASKAGDRVAVRLGRRTLGFGELDAVSSVVAASLRARGVEPGDRVGLMLPNGLEFPACYFGALRMGAVVVPMNVQLKPREIAHIVRDSGATVVLAGEEVEAVAAEGIQLAGVAGDAMTPGSLTDGGPAGGEDPLGREPDDTAVILYTSGTTGSPKGAELTHANIGRNTQAISELFGLGGSDVILGALPLFHAFGQICGMVAAVAAGAELSLLPRFDAGRVLKILEGDRTTVFMGVPTMYGALLSEAESRHVSAESLRLCLSGAASLPAELMRNFEQRFGCVILEGYGLSETSPVASFNRSAEQRRPGSVGRPIAGVEMRIVDADDEEVPAGEVGEIVIRGHNIMKGYWNRPEATAVSITSSIARRT